MTLATGNNKGNVAILSFFLDLLRIPKMQELVYTEAFLLFQLFGIKIVSANSVPKIFAAIFWVKDLGHIFFFIEKWDLSFELFFA